MMMKHDDLSVRNVAPVHMTLTDPRGGKFKKRLALTPYS